MSESVLPRVYEALKYVLENESITDFDIKFHDKNKKGEGYLGEIVFVTLKDKRSDKVIDLVVKQAFRNQSIRDHIPIRDIYLNEIYFYTQVWERFNQFQKQIPLKCQFQKIPKCYTTVSDANCEHIILENLKFQNFVLHDKKMPLNKEHYEVILKEYGKFHALSFAYKTLHPEEFGDLTNKLQDVYLDISKGELLQLGIKKAIEHSISSLPADVSEAAVEKFKSYRESFLKLFQDSCDGNTEYTVVTHGDCWSNNMMFKYDDDGKLTDVRFLDFQLSKVGSPCCDLSYCIYSGASKEILQDFDYYLRVYHNSLSETLRAFGCNPAETFPWEGLINDWKKYCKLGLFMSLLVWKQKLTKDYNITDLTDLAHIDEQRKQSLSDGYDKEAFGEVSKNLISHLFENDFM